jgi:hypothetical protein
VRALALVDTDSYVKWGAALLAQLPDTWVRDVAVVATPGAPSAGQLAAALAGSGFEGAARVLTLDSIARLIELEQTDVVIAGACGIRRLARAV